MEEYIDTYLYRTHEVRLASEPMPSDQEDDSRNKAAHVTNGAKETELLHESPALKNIQDQLELFIAQIFAKHLIQDISRRVAVSSREDKSSSQATKFVIAGLDIMVTEDKRLYLLEVNVNPLIPSPDAVNDVFQAHLVGFMRDLVDLVVGKPSPNFISGNALLSKHDSK